MTDFSSRAQTAISHLKTGGYFRKQLETGYRGREQFHTRLRDNNGNVVKGVGIKAFFELEQAGLLQWRQCPRSTVWPEEYILRATPLSP